MCVIFACLVPGFIVCLVSSFRYNGLATLALAAFGRVWALRARCEPLRPAIALKRGRGRSPPPLLRQGGFSGGSSIPPSLCVHSSSFQRLL